MTNETGDFHLESDECRAVGSSPEGGVSYEVIGGNSKKRTALPRRLLDYLLAWRTKGGFKGLLEHFAQSGAIDGTTLEIIRAKMERPNLNERFTDSSMGVPSNEKVEQKVHALTRLSEDDGKKLSVAVATKAECLSNGQWARLLGFKSRQGAYEFLIRMQREGFVVLKKSPQRSTGITPTSEELSILRSLNKVK